MSVSLPVEGPGDAELISAVRGGDVDAYGDLFARHVDAARRLARQLAGPADADDLVSDAFTKVLTVLQRGGGPDLAFRAYLLTAVRRLHVDKIRSGSRLRPVDDLTPFDPGLPFHDTAVEGFENAAAAKAFASLPERWQMVLWHTEVEQQKPADIAPLLGMSANSVSALAYRAREGLRQAFLGQHATDPDDVDCAWTRDHLGAYVRSGLSRRDAARVDDHLATCRSCAAVYLELTEVNSGLAGILAPLLLGSAGVGYLSSSGGAGAGAGAGSSVLSNSFNAARTWATAHASLTAIGGMLVTATAVASIYGAAHLHSRDAADLGSPPPLNHGTATSTVGPNGTHHGRSDGTDRNDSKGPDSGQSSAPPATGATTAPTTTTTSGVPSDNPSTAGDTSGGPTDSTSGPTDSTSGPTDPTSSPTGPPGGGGDLEFTSTPPADPVFGDTYKLHARGGSGKQIDFAIDTATTHQACSLDDAGTTVTFDHAGLCVISAHADARDRSGSGASRSATDATQRVRIDQEDQQISFRSPTDASVGTHDTLTGSSSSGLPVTFSVDPSSTNGACDVTGSKVTYHHALSCSVVASQSGDHDYRAAGDVSRTFDVAKGTQTIHFAASAPDDAVVDGTPYALAATSSTGNPVTFAVDDAATTNDACALTDTRVAFHHHGTCAITADAAGDDDYLPATGEQTFGVGKGTQTLTFGSDAPDDAVVDGTPYAPTATSSTGNPVTFAVDDAATSNDACALTDTRVAFHHHGTCAITADAAGNDDYLPATGEQTFGVGKGTQTIAFTSSAPDNAAVGSTPYLVSGTSSSGDPVTFDTDASTNGACALNGSMVSFQHRGTCTISASDAAGNDDYLPATGEQSFDVGKGTQVITFTSTPPADPAVHSTYDVAATSTSGEDVTFSSATPRVCSISGSRVTLDHAGRCEIDADQAGTDDFQSAATVTQSVVVAKAAQTITFTSQPPSAPAFGSHYDVSATSSSGAPVTFSIDQATTNRACSLDDSGSRVTFNHAGLCVLDADQAGTDDFQAAPTVSQSVVVPKAAQTITFTSKPPVAPALGSTYAVSATSTSGQPVSFSSGSPDVCSVSGSTVTFAHAGSCVVDADQAGNDDYRSAATAVQSVDVAKAAQKITFTSTPPTAPGLGSTYTVQATSGSGEPVAFSVDPATTRSACTVSGSTVTFAHAGRCVLDADQAGNKDYQPAATATQGIDVPKAAQKITFTSTPPTAAKVGGSYQVSATGGASGKPVTFSSTTTKVCTVSGSTVSFVTAGTCTIAADQAGNDDYVAAPTATQQVTVGGGRDLTLSVDTHSGWLFGQFGTIADVTVTGLDPGAHATLAMTSHNAFVWSPRDCDTSGATTSCAVSSTPTTLSFLGLAINGSMTFTVTSTDSIDSDPSDNTVTVPVH